MPLKLLILYNFILKLICKYFTIIIPITSIIAINEVIRTQEDIIFGNIMLNKEYPRKYVLKFLEKFTHL